MTAPSQTGRRDWTVMGLIEWTAGHLATRGFDESRLTVELLLAHVLRLKRLDLYLQFDRMLLPPELASFRALYERRLAHEPLQYILGETEFMGLHLAVRPGVLIPRPETEHLVEEAVAIALRRGDIPLEVLDAGTGTGNIALAIARQLPLARVLSIDISKEALRLAEQNRASLSIENASFVEADLFDYRRGGEPFDLLVSNPPYIPAEDFAALQPEVREFEPRDALSDGADGLRFYRRIAECSGDLLAVGGSVVVEVGFGQAGAVVSFFEAAGLACVTVRKDYAGIDRIVSAQRP